MPVGVGRGSGDIYTKRVKITLSWLGNPRGRKIRPGGGKEGGGSGG